jgi:rubrerythrin
MMVTTVGLQTDFISALKQLITLDYDAIDAYEAAINRLENENYKAMFEEFKSDHERHIDEVSEFLIKNNETPPVSSSMKSLLTQGKVVLANLIGDVAILRAMRSNEIDTNTAYGRINNYEEIPEEIEEVLKNGLQDEKRHLAWIEQNLE